MIAKYCLIILSFIFLYSCNSSDTINKVKLKDSSTLFTDSIINISDESKHNMIDNEDISVTDKYIIKAVDHEIFYTNEWYKPKNVTINIWDTVSFINNSTLSMWTASDPHPEHTDYSLFDALQSYNPGEIYSLIYNESGSYGFHNHQKSLHRGVVQVVDPNNPSPNIDKTKEKDRDQRDLLLQKMDRDDPNSIFTVISLIEADPELAKNCHDIYHDTWHKSYELYGFSTAITLSYMESPDRAAISSICAWGYMHGILEALYLYHPELKTNPEKVCNTVPDKYKDSCFHWLGHGLMFAYSRNLEKSLWWCRVISSNHFINQCFEWVWMELFWWNTDHFWDDSLWWDLEKPFQSCENAKIDAKSSCYMYTPLWYLRTHLRSATQWFIDFCMKEKLSIDQSKLCFKGLSQGLAVINRFDMIDNFTNHPLKSYEILIQDLTEELKEWYYSWFIWYDLLPGIKNINLLPLCNSLENDKNVCLKVLSESE